MEQLLKHLLSDASVAKYERFCECLGNERLALIVLRRHAAAALTSTTTDGDATITRLTSARPYG
jgi:hypothetical protein